MLRGKIIALSSRLKKEEERKQLNLERSIRDLEQKHARLSHPNILEELDQQRQELNELLTYKAEGAIRFSNQNYYEAGNRTSKLLAFQLRIAQISRLVSKIVNPTSKKLVSHLKDIAKAFSIYYKSL